MGWTFYNSSGQQLKSGQTAISNLDIDGATDIGAAIVDADLFIIDDGAGGTNRKTAASRLKTYIGAAATQAEMEAASSNTVFVTPGRTKNHPGVAKAWSKFYWDSGTPTETSGYNISSYSDNGTGDCSINFTASLSGNGCTVGPGYNSSGGGAALSNFGSSGFMRVEHVNTSSANADQSASPGEGHAIFGDFS
jgi:hypothetical protein